jgi:hypothetical protein
MADDNYPDKSVETYETAPDWTPDREFELVVAEQSYLVNQFGNQHAIRLADQPSNLFSKDWADYTDDDMDTWEESDFYHALNGTESVPDIPYHRELARPDDEVESKVCGPCLAETLLAEEEIIFDPYPAPEREAKTYVQANVNYPPTPPPSPVVVEDTTMAVETHELVYEEMDFSSPPSPPPLLSREITTIHEELDSKGSDNPIVPQPALKRYVEELSTPESPTASEPDFRNTTSLAGGVVSSKPAATEKKSHTTTLELLPTPSSMKDSNSPAPKANRRRRRKKTSQKKSEEKSKNSVCPPVQPKPNSKPSRPKPKGESKDNSQRRPPLQRQHDVSSQKVSSPNRIRGEDTSQAQEISSMLKLVLTRLEKLEQLSSLPKLE